VHVVVCFGGWRGGGGGDQRRLFPRPFSSRKEAADDGLQCLHFGEATHKAIIKWIAANQ